MIIFTDGGKFPATKEMIGFPQVTKILSKFSLRTKIKVNISTKLYRFPPIRQDSWTGRKSCESKGGVVSPGGWLSSDNKANLSPADLATASRCLTG